MLGAAPSSLDSDVRDLVMLLWRRRVFLVSLMLLSVFVVFVLITIMPARYTARAQIMIEQPALLPADLKPAVAPDRHDNALVFSEVEVMTSRALALRVIEQAGLMNDPDINPQLRVGHTVLSVLSGMDEPDISFKTLSLYDRHAKNLPPDILDQSKGQVVDEFLSMLHARAVPGSFVIQLEFTAHHPSKAAMIANALADAYLAQRLETKHDRARQTAQWLEKRLGELKEEVRAADAAVEAYRADHGLSAGTAGEVSAQQVSEINSRLVLAKSRLAEADARLTEINNWSKDNKRLEAASEVLESRVMQQYKIDEAVLLREISEMSSRYGARHPSMIKVRAELSDLHRKMAAEMGVIAQGIKNDRAIAAAQVASLQKELESIEAVRREDDQAHAPLRQLVQQADSSRAILDTFIQSYQKSMQQDLLHQADARVVSYAMVPSEPSFPNTPLFLSLSVVGALFAGVGLCLLREKLDGTVHSGSMLESMTGFPAYGMVPLVNDKIRGAIGDYILDHPDSPPAEAVQALRLMIALRGKPVAPQTIMVTSSLPGEGKTVLSSWLARSAAKAGEKVLLIDADMRRPAVQAALDLPVKQTLHDYLQGRAASEDIIHPDQKSGLHVILAGKADGQSLPLLAGPQMNQLMEALKKTYDLIIIDTPASLAVSDARALAGASDLILFAVAWESTPRDLVQAGIKPLFDLQAAPMAFVLTQVDIKRQAAYGYGAAFYDYDKYRARSAA